MIKHGPHWIHFIVLTFINEKNRDFKCPYRIWSKIISFDMRRNLKHVIGFMKKKVTLGVLGVNPYVSNGVPQPYLDPSCFCHCGHAVAKLLIVHSKHVFCLTYLHIMEF